MDFKRSLGYTFNKELPILEDCNNDYYTINDIIIFESSNGNHIIRFTDAYNLAKYHDIGINECINEIILFHSNVENPIFVVNEMMYYGNNDYKNAVLEASQYYPYMQFQPIDMSTIFGKILESCISLDLQNNNTEYTDRFLNEGIFDRILGASDKVSGLFQQGMDKVEGAIDKAGGNIDKAINDLGSQAANKFWNWSADKLNDPKVQERIANAGNGVLKKTADKVLTKENIAVGATAGLTATLGLINKLTNSQALNGTGNNLQNIQGQLNGQLNRLENMQKTAPPQQQGFISRMIAKIQAALRTIAQKLGFGGNNAQQAPQ